ncbi:hypothetical protein ACQP3J_32350, partial [Escherichia coli]
MTKKLGALAAFIENSGSIPGTHMTSQPSATPSLGDMMHSSSLHGFLHALVYMNSSKHTPTHT